MSDEVRGPAIAEWKSLMAGLGRRSWKELMTWLKDGHGVGHGHGNALELDYLHDLGCRSSVASTDVQWPAPTSQGPHRRPRARQPGRRTRPRVRQPGRRTRPRARQPGRRTRPRVRQPGRRTRPRVRPAILNVRRRRHLQTLPTKRNHLGFGQRVEDGSRASRPERE